MPRLSNKICNNGVFGSQHNVLSRLVHAVVFDGKSELLTYKVVRISFWDE
jgi:hypothetical protein